MCFSLVSCILKLTPLTLTTLYYYSHRYHSNQQMETDFTVQRFWVKRRDLQAGTENWVINPKVVNMEPCVRCQSPFRMEQNHSYACRIHEAPDGRCVSLALSRSLSLSLSPSLSLRLLG